MQKLLYDNMSEKKSYINKAFNRLKTTGSLFSNSPYNFFTFNLIKTQTSVFYAYITILSC